MKERSTAQRIWKTLGPGLGRIVTIISGIVAIASGVAAFKLDPSTTKTVMIVICVQAFMAFLAFLYINHVLVSLANRVGRGEEDEMDLRRSFTRLREDAQRDENVGRMEMMRYMKLLANMHHYHFRQTHVTDRGVMGSIQEQRFIAEQREERETMVRWLQQGNRDLPPNIIEHMVDQFYSRTSEVIAN